MANVLTLLFIVISYTDRSYTLPQTHGSIGIASADSPAWAACALKRFRLNRGFFWGGFGISTKAGVDDTTAQAHVAVIQYG